MLEEGRQYAKWHKNIYVKVPMTANGLAATRILREEGININVTLVFSLPQALMAAKAGATFISPFVGRIDDISYDGMHLIEEIVTAFNNYNFHTEILAASIRHPKHIVDAALIGADIATMPAEVMEKLIKHPLTDLGLERFLADWEKAKK